MEKLIAELKTRLAEVSDLQNAAALLEWDQQTYMPPGGARARADQLATLRRTAHTLFISDEMGRLLHDLEPLVADLSYESDHASLVRVTAREYRKQRRLPPSLVAERARTAALAHPVWEAARANADFERFRPHLEKIVQVTIQVAEALGYEDRIYDALLDLYEPDMRTDSVSAIFEELKGGLIPLVRAASAHDAAVDDAVLRGEFPFKAQIALCEDVLRLIGFDFDRGRQDISTHPFTTSFSPNDVRVTTRIDPEYLASGLFATIHEGGHALYEQGLPQHLARTPLCDGASMGVHESQSRMWENIVGRSRGFWQFFLPRVKERFPAAMDGVSVEQIYRAVNRVKPGYIRVEADEVTYNLHILLRFELENDLVEQRLAVSDLPEAWNAKMEQYLGRTPPNDALGVLQDVHWSGASFGYFPTYTLGNLLAVQFYSEALSQVPEIPEQIARGDLTPLVHWMRENIHSRGARLTPKELVQSVTGSPISAGPFLDYVQTKYDAIYGL